MTQKIECDNVPAFLIQALGKVTISATMIAQAMSDDHDSV